MSVSGYPIQFRAAAATLAAALVLGWAGCDKAKTAPPGAKEATASVKPAVAAKVAMAAGATPTVAGTAAKIAFNDQIEPILSENCYSCHGPDPGSRKAGLRLDRADFAFAPHEKSGPAIVRGKPDDSPLIKRIESASDKERMPPVETHKTLRAEEIALLRRWVAEGAEYQEHWAFIPPKRPAVPTGLTTPGGNPVDAFIRARLAKEQIASSPEADRRSLIRRVTLDLTGLPPTPTEVTAFVADQAPGSYERVVDRLLASPRYGEHRARYWLDYVRYADTHGIHFDNYRSIWPYRDYVIRAFNADKPFDRFVREQLAGDLLPARTLDELAATGFVRCNLTTNEGGTVTEEVYVNQTRDRVEAFGATFLGLTTGCAACHDHKFDPISQRDFYGLAAFLGNTLEKPWDSNVADPMPVLRLPAEENRASAEMILAKRAELQEKLAARRAQGLQLIAAWLAAGHHPQPVSADRLELRLKLDELRGDVVKNSAPHAAVTEYKADTNPLVWGENSWLWPSMRMDIFTHLPLGKTGDVEAGDKFSAGAWLMLRDKPGLGGKGTGEGALLSRMGDAKNHAGAGWEIYQSGGQFIVSLIADTSGAAEKPAAKAETDAVETPGKKKPMVATPAARGIQVITKNVYVRDEWTHVFFTYDGSRKAAGVKLYINGKPAEIEVRLDTLAARDTIRTPATTELGRRDDFQPMRETRYQDVRFYARALAPEEVARLPFEHIASEILARQPDPAKWTTDEKFVAVDRFFLGETDEEAKRLAAAVAAHDAAFAALTKDGTPTLIAVERASPGYADILKRGDYYSRVERVGPATPHFLPKLAEGEPLNRRGLADWLLSPEQPLMPRVVVNRMWQEIFGRGLVDSAGDFGVMGTKPSHPELLDWLAVEFRESGWDVKKMYRLLVTSATYRQSANVTPEALAKDPGNRFLGRGPRFRMDAEMLRDSALAASGLLVEKIGGPSVKPYQPPGLWEEVAMPESNTKTYVADKGEGLYRRSVYTFWKRGSMPPALETFDATSREVACPRRARTDTPLQAFVTMNDPQWVEAARKLAERAMHAAAARDGRLDFLAETTLGRPLEAREIGILAQSEEKFRAHFAADGEAAKEILSVGDSPRDPQLPAAELADWTMVASEFLNLDEFFTK